MGVKITDEKFTPQFKITSPTTWQLGNVGDWIKYSCRAEFSVSKTFSITDSITIADPNTLTLNSGKTWKSLGFDVGFDCTLVYHYTDIAGSGTPQRTTISFQIESLLDNVLTAKNPSGAPITTWSYSYGAIAPIGTSTYEISNVYVYANKPPEGIRVNFSQVENALGQTGTLKSHIDGTETSMVAKDTHTIGVNVVDYLSFQSGMSLENATVTYLSSQDYKYFYDIELVFMISTFYEEITDYEDNIAPSWVRGVKAITNMIQIIGYPTYNNPNIQISNDPKQTFQLGNTGWFDENFNQLSNPFTFTPVVYKVNGVVVPQLDYANPTVMTTTLSGLTAATGVEMFQYGFQWATIESQNYKEVLTSYHRNTKISTGGLGGSLGDVFQVSPLTYSAFPALRLGYSTDGATMDASDIEFKPNGNDIDVSITWRPNAAFTTFMSALSDEERKYILWVSIGDPVPATNLGNRVSLKLDFNTLKTEPIPIGEFTGLTIDYLDHPQIESDTPRLGGNTIYIEDGILAKVEFLEDTATGSDVPIINGITFGTLIQNTVDESNYILDATNVNLEDYPSPEQYNYDVTRDFKLVPDNNKNFLKVEYDATRDTTTFRGVLGLYGFKVRWESWKERFPHAPSEFYNNLLAKNGFNQDWYDYFAVANQELYFYVKIQATLNDLAVEYTNLKELNIKDYDSNATISTAFSWFSNNGGVKGAAISGGAGVGVIVSDDFVFLDVVYTSTGTPFTNQSYVDNNIYCITEIEVQNGGGQTEIRQLSSIYLQEINNPLIPLTGLTVLSVTWDSTSQITASCMVEANKLIDADTYKVTGKIGGK